MSDEKNTPIWKKEISFRRKPDEGTAESDPGSASLWKKEISFGKKAKEADADGVSAADCRPRGRAGSSARRCSDRRPGPDRQVRAAARARRASVGPVPPDPVAQAPIQPAPIEHDWLTKPLEEVSEPPEEPLALVPDLLPEAPPSPISLVPAVEEAESTLGSRSSRSRRRTGRRAGTARAACSPPRCPSSSSTSTSSSRPRSSYPSFRPRSSRPSCHRQRSHRRRRSPLCRSFLPSRTQMSPRP